MWLGMAALAAEATVEAATAAAMLVEVAQEEGVMEAGGRRKVEQAVLVLAVRRDADTPRDQRGGSP